MNSSSMPTVPDTVERADFVDIQAFLAPYERPSYSDLSLICCAVSSNIRTNRTKPEMQMDRETARLVPGIKPFFFHSLAYDPAESCRADEVIAHNWSSINIERLRLGVESRDQSDVRNQSL